MPRGQRRQTQAGAPAQGVRSTPGRRYGEGVTAARLHAVAPPVDAQAAAAAQRARVAPTQAPAAAPPGLPPDLAALLANAPVGMLAGTVRPDEPVTAGLSQGPGPGPEVLMSGGAQTPLSRMLRELSRRSGDPEFAALADRAGL